MKTEIGRSRIPDLLNGRTQSWLAKKAGISTSYLSKIILHGEGGIIVYRKIARVLNCHIDDLVEWIEED